jgi:predicted RNase H-like nuclease
MQNIAGIDGCRSGWFCIFEELPSRKVASKIFPTINDLARHVETVDVVVIDVPIGLKDRGPRGCDVAARKMLGPVRGSSVFPAPIRPAIGAATYEEACSTSFAAQGKKLSKQSWAIYPKIRELDALLRSRPELCERIFEVHPEVSFCAWNGMEPIVEPKKKRPGATKRRALIADHFGPAAFDTIRVRYPKKEVADDDILDAFAALWTAERILRRESGTLPKEAETDSASLPMRMVY